jgi:hypothetical protein
MFTKTQKFANFQTSKVSNKAAQNILGGAGTGSDEHCERLEASLEEAIAAGDLDLAQSLRGAIRRICGYPSRI